MAEKSKPGQPSKHHEVTLEAGLWAPDVGFCKRSRPEAPGKGSRPDCFLCAQFWALPAHAADKEAIPYALELRTKVQETASWHAETRTFKPELDEAPGLKLLLGGDPRV